jgi:omega-amidase
MQDLTISLVQIDQVWEDKKANFSLYEEELARIEKTDLILLPEMFQTGFSMNTELAEPFATSESIAWLKEKAKEKQAAIYTSLMIIENGETTNRGVFVCPSGELDFYDKRKTFTLAGEHQKITAGKFQKIIDYLGWKIQLQICYDLRFPEIHRNKWNSSNGSADYDVLLFVANWPAKRGEHWRTLLKARAIENQCFVAAVNRVGKDMKELYYIGDSTIFDALGNQLNDFSNEQGVVSTVLEFQDLQKIRAALPFLKDQDVTNC